MKPSNRLILGISGASGAIYGIRLLECLRELGIERHLIISQAAALTLAQETAFSIEEVKALADYAYSPKDFAAAISSGSFPTDGMIVAPCSMRSLAEIASGVTTSLLGRAADVTLKERRRLVLMVRETPLTSIHLENMLRVTQAGGIIAPPVPAFYQCPETLDDLINHTVGRVLDLYGLPMPGLKRWQGMTPLGKKS